MNSWYVVVIMHGNGTHEYLYHIDVFGNIATVADQNRAATFNTYEDARKQQDRLYGQYNSIIVEMVAQTA